MREEDTKKIAIHRLLKEEFTEEQLRIILVSALENITNNNHEKIVHMLDNFYVMFNSH